MSMGCFNLTVKPVKWAETAAPFAERLVNDRVLVESYYEEHILAANHYGIFDGGGLAGWFSVHGGHDLWAFYVYPRYAEESRRLFAAAKSFEEVSGAYVHSADELFMNLCLDNYEKLEKQAVLSYYVNPFDESRRLPLTLRLADIEADAGTLALAKDFLDPEIKRLKERTEDRAALKLYIAEHGGDTAGFGVTEAGRIQTANISIGMYVLEGKRRQGYGANILNTLREAAEARGLTVLSGYWYYNHNSYKTQEAAGAVARSRLIKFGF
jgi:GNAT superfamily N-acetyltransferase